LPPAAPDSSAPGSAGTPAVTGTINLTMPLSTWIGLSQSPGDVSGFGPLTADDCRHLGAVLGAHPRTRWCLTVTGQDGHPVAHGCARSGRGQRGPPGGGAGPPPADPGAWVAGISLEWLETGECTHRRDSASYRPPPSLQHLIRVRQQVCAYPGCGRPARQCDLDHSIPYHRGGRTCECNLAPLCRRHHQAKQALGWTLEQPHPGVLVWTTPSGRSYSTCPSIYPG
jgi:hypothetical protein